MPEHPLIVTARTVSVLTGSSAHLAHALSILDARAGFLLRVFPPSASTAHLAELKTVVDQAEEIIRNRAAERRAEAQKPQPTDSRWEQNVGSRFD